MLYPIQQLLYADHAITKVKPTTMQASEKNIAIVIHIFYIDVWQEIKNYLTCLDIDYDLFITIPENTPDEHIIEIFKETPHIHLYMTENRGRDVLPFLQIMQIIGTDSYKYICKMHTKKTGDSALGHVWRKLLYYDLIGSNETVQEILQSFKNDETIGMVTGKNTILDSQRYTYGNDRNIQHLATLTGIIYDEYYHFPAGTMFWTRAEIIAPIVEQFSKGTLVFEEEAGQKDNTLAHAIERFFGIIAQSQHKRIVESPSLYSKLNDTTLDEVASLVLSQQYVGADVFASQKHMIHELEATLKFKESEVETLIEIAESMRIKNRIKNLYPDKILPRLQKSAKIPKKIVSILHVAKNNPTLLKKVFYYAKRGELKYLIHKIREKSGQNITESNQLIEVNIEDYFQPFKKEDFTLNDTTIDIIIPIYNGYKFLEPLFNSIERNTTSPYRLIVINDCSPDERIKPYLVKKLENHPTAIFIDHSENKGFLLSVNEAHTHTSNHFVLLNTDTEVPSLWLERLMYPIIHMDNIASTTPFTNSGEIASFPHFVADNEIFDGLSVEDLDSNFKMVNPKSFYAEVPTGVGFCMGVNHTLSQQIGMFAEDTFGKGYGEENDWCQRAIKAGYKNLIVPNLFVYHKHGGSFSAEEKQKLLQKNAVTLLERHPNYSKDVNDYIQLNPHDTLRHILVLKASNQTHGIHLIFDHALGGGANIYTQERIDQYIQEDKNVLLIAYDYYSHCYTLTHRYKAYNFSFKITTFEALTQFLDTLILEEIFINNLVSYKNIFNVLEYITSLLEDRTTQLIIPIHDMYAFCPSYNLLNEEGKYCGIPSLEACKKCMASNMQEWRNFYHDEVDMIKWREIWGELLALSNEILCFSNSSKDILLRAYPDIDDTILTVIPHEVTGINPLIIKKDPNNHSITIGILGAINYVKGSQIIKQMIQLIERDKLDINIVVIGEITEPIKSKHFHSTGKYKRDELPTIIQEHQIDIFLIPSIWPETFSYTTQEIMMMELPLMVFDLGAPAERVKDYEKGYIIKDISAEAALKMSQDIL